MIKHEGSPSFSEQKAAETLEKQAHTLAEAISIVAPENSTTSPLEVFPEPGERRADTEFSLPPHQEKAFREAMARLGIGRETNLSASEVGLKDGYVAIIEGGQAHKMLAELNVVLADKSIRPTAIIVAASPDRVIPEPENDKAKEKEVTAKVLGIDVENVGANEYDVAMQVAESITIFHKIAKHYHPIGYDLEGNVSGDYNSEQFKQIGFIGNALVVMLRVDRKYSEGGKYETLGARGLIEVVNGYLNLRATGGNLGFVTSATYQPSREIDAASAMIEIERQGNSRNVGVITYGTQELAKVKKEDYPAPVALGQLAGEAHKAAKQLEALRALVGSE